MSEPRSPADIGNIIEQSASAEVLPASAERDYVEELAEQVDLLIADLGRLETFKGASAEYVSEFTTEIRWHRRLRLGVTIVCGLVLLFLAASLISCLVYAREIFGDDPGHSLTALIVATITGIVVISVALARGAFSNISERNAGLPMPEHLKDAVEAIKSMMGN